LQKFLKCIEHKANLVVRHLFHVEMSGIVDSHSSVAIIIRMKGTPRIWKLKERINSFRTALTLITLKNAQIMNNINNNSCQFKHIKFVKRFIFISRQPLDILVCL